MQKDFDIWNENKKQINLLNKNHWVKERFVYLCQLGQNVGFEEDGKGDLFLRPVLIIKTFNLCVSLVVPLTTKLKENRFYMNIGYIKNSEASAILSQIRLVDTKRLIKKIDKIDIVTFTKVKDAIKNLF